MDSALQVISKPLCVSSPGGTLFLIFTMRSEQGWERTLGRRG